MSLRLIDRLSTKEMFVLNKIFFQNATGFDVGVEEDQESLPTFYWLPKEHKHPY